MEIHPRTEATLAQLREVEWFRNVGVRDTEAAIILSSWEEAIASCASVEWENLCLEAANQYAERIRERAPEAFERWNDVASTVKPHAEAVVKEKTEDVVAREKLPKVFIDTVEWDMIHLLIESEYADVYPAGFYASQAYWYVQGHFPCGWKGPFPNGGKLIIY